jgi:pilus assembly protein CpaF
MESYKYEKAKELLKKQVMDSMNLFEDISDANILNLIDEHLTNLEEYKKLALGIKRRLREDVYNSLRKLDILQQLVDDSEITEIMVNSYDTIFIERNGKIVRWQGKFESREKYYDVIQRIVSNVNRIVNESNPIADARLEDGSRVNIVLPPVAIDGAVLTIRKFPRKVINIEDLIQKESLTFEAATFLDLLVKARYNIFISGGTSSGKTTLLNAIAGLIPAQERIITIEDSAELQIFNIPNIVRLEVKNESAEGGKGVSIRDLIKSSLRMRPDRIIVGEVRDQAAIDLLSAYNTGHDGSISTGHANSAKDMITRLEGMVLMGSEIPIEAIRRQIASAIDILIHLSRLRDKSRRVMEISEVVGIRDGEVIVNPIYEFIEEESRTEKVHGKLAFTGNELIHRDKLVKAGLLYEYTRGMGINEG